MVCSLCGNGASRNATHVVSAAHKKKLIRLFFLIKQKELPDHPLAEYYATFS